MRELYVISRMDLGGAERIVVQLAASARHRDAVATVCSSGGVWVPRLTEAGVTHHQLPRMRRNPLRMAQAVARLAGIIREERPDVIHAVNVKATGVTSAAIRLARWKGPLITSLHGVPPDEYRGAARVLSRTSTRVVACAPAVAAHLRDAGMPGERIDVVTNSVVLTPADEARLATMRSAVGAPDQRPVVVGIGRLVEQKDWPTWLAVAAKVPEAWFALAGDGPLLDDVRSRARAAGNVAVLGRVDDVAALHGAATLFLSTSLWEGLPLSLLEALSLGLPAVVTAVDGVTDAVPATAAAFVAPGDVDGIAVAVRSLLGDADRRATLAAAALAVASGSDDDVVSGYDAVHRAACHSSVQPG